MSIRDQGYQRYDGARTAHAARWSVVFRHTVRSSMRQPGVIAIVIIAGVVMLPWMVVQYFQLQALTQAAAQLSAEQLKMYVPNDPGTDALRILVSTVGMPMFGFLVALFAGGAAIADDIRQNAFQFYFARPLSRDQYMIGKATGVVLVVWLTLLIPSVAVTLVRLAMYRSGVDSIGPLLLLPWRAILVSFIEAVALALPALALSSLSSSRGLVQGGYAVLYLLPWLTGLILGYLLRSAWAGILSVPALIDAVGGRIFAYTYKPDERVLPWLPSLCVLAVMVIAAAALLRWRLSSVDVVQG